MNLDALRHGFRGELLTPASPGYDDARRIWNAMIDRRPAAIARCSDVDDVIAAVRFAAREGLHPAIRGGGHNAAGLAMVDDDLVIDVSPMKRISVDPATRTAIAETGLNCGAAADASQTVWTRAFYEAMQPWSASLVYVNTLSEDDGDRVVEAYGTHYRRLAEVKSKYDPDNRFRRNQNIIPARPIAEPSLRRSMEQEMRASP
jgi:FAD/FMN-containing dehydrogenase